MKKIEPLELPPIPREITGLKKDENRDRRFKAGNTMAEIQGYMESASGVNLLIEKKEKG
jgi:hypothetical protein